VFEGGEDMNERIKELAEQAGYTKDMFGFGHWDMPECIKFAELVRQDERESCAKLCDKAAYWDGHVAANCAAAIRGRTE
jgi:hypothetical protein